ncbi:PAS domain S-box protein [Fortiea sp. LEGE XX443]|uniref:PAS domain-containing hybrid sensor histidine kinase/response regulator n=1 Tax=Fortiea sp. LEGE XX443 TaxID=1828611 RepID=UPI001881662B|nr:ATP-binding protein [Fortiea sp. LEGE XX443]MBE9007158.1 PAS domain S-box protein [Fortiea sp. LEGE XX443]
MLNSNHLQLQDVRNSIVVRVAAAISTLAGSFVLLGWMFDIEFLKNGNYPSLLTMTANTALCFVLLGVSLWLLQINKNKQSDVGLRQKIKVVVRALSLVPIIVASLTIIEYLFGWNFGIDELLFQDSPTPLLTSYPGRMGLNTALNFLLLGSALEFLVSLKSNCRNWYSQILVLIAGVISLEALIGYAYNVKILYSLFPSGTPMALHTVVLFSVLCVGILWSHVDKGFMRVVMSETYSGLLARRLLIAAIAVPLLSGWLIIQGQRNRHYDTAFAIAVFALILIIVFTFLIWQCAVVVQRLWYKNECAQKALRAYEEKLRSFVDSNVISILFGDVYGNIHQANDKFLGMMGYTREDLLAGRLNWEKITPPENLHLDEQAIAEAKANSTGACTPYKKEYIHKDGSRIPILIGYVLVGEKREESVAFILDLSDRQQAEEKILQLNRDLQRRVVELQTLLDVIPIGIGIAEDPECQNIRVNPCFAKQLGITPDQNASLSAPAEERPTTFKAYREGRELLPEELPMQYSAAHGVEVLNFEVDIIHDNGKVVNLLEYVAPLFDEEGKTRGCIGAFLDITSRKQTEELQQNQQKWLEDVLNLMPRPLLFIEPGTGRVTFANRAANELAGGEFPQGIPAEEHHTVYHYTDATGNRIPNDQMPGVRVARGERLDGVEMDWHTSKGVHSLLIFADTLPAMHSYPATCVVVFQDVTKLKQVEKALSLGNKRLQLLFNTASALLSSQEPLALINSVFCQLQEQISLDVYFNYLVEDNSQVMRLASYGGVAEELAKEIEWLEFGQAVCGTAAQCRQLIYVEDVQQATDVKTELIRSLGVKAYYCYPLIAQGKLFGTLSFGSRRRDFFTENQRGMMQAVGDQIAIAMERSSLITSLQQQTEQLQAANRMKDEFLAILSHELRSPLNAILGWAQLLRSRKLSDIQMAKALETIERNARAQTQMIEDLLDISRMIRGNLRLKVSTCNLVPIIESTIETVTLAAQAKEIELQFSRFEEWEPQHNENGASLTPLLCCVPQDTDLPPQFLISGDCDRLQQIIWNLLSNAIKFTPKGGKVEIKLSKNIGHVQESLLIPSYAQIQIIDTGIGIKREFLPYVFDRFRQADSSSTRAHGGLGLGLAIVRHLVELHGGTLHVESMGEGQGATFTVKLPLLLPNKETISQPLSIPEANLDVVPLCPLLTGVRVLVVDDEADTREYMTTVLQQCQAEVQAVGSAQEALQVIFQWQPDVLISDIGMPGEDGYSLIRQLRSQPPEQGGKIPAAALTAYARAEDRMRAIQEGFQLHLPKPIEPAELATVVASLVRRT